MKNFAIIDERNDWYAATDDAKQAVPTGHRIIPITDAKSLSRSYEPHHDDPELLKKRIAEIRYGKESQGITVGTQPVTTLREEMPIWQGMLLDLAVFRPGVLQAFEYKPRGGVNTTLTPTQVQRCYECFAWYVGACFATERTLIAAIDVGTALSTVADLADNNATWPQTTFDWIAPV